VIQWGGTDGMTPLHLAIKTQCLKCMQHLLDFYRGKLPKSRFENDKGTRPKAPTETDIWGRQALHIAIGNANLKICKALINSVDTLPDRPDYFNRTPLDYVFAESNRDVVFVKTRSSLLSAMLDKMNPDSLVTKLSDGSTLAHRAVTENDLEAVKKITENKAVLLVKDSQGRSLLHIAAMSAKSNSIVKHLVDNGTRLEDKDAIGRTPLMMACAYSAVGAAEIILARTGNVRDEEKELLLALANQNTTISLLLFHFSTDEKSSRSFLNFVFENPAWRDVNVRLPKLFTGHFQWTIETAPLDLARLRCLGSIEAMQGYLKGAIGAFQGNEEQLVTFVKHLGHFELAVLARLDMDDLRQKLEATLQDHWPNLIQPKLTNPDMDGWSIASWLTRWRVRPPSLPAWAAELHTRTEKITSSESSFRIPDECSGDIEYTVSNEMLGTVSPDMSFGAELSLTPSFRCDNLRDR